MSTLEVDTAPKAVILVFAILIGIPLMKCLSDDCSKRECPAGTSPRLIGRGECHCVAESE